MNLWWIRLMDVNGEISADNPQWIVCTHGGSNDHELKRQIEDAKESIELETNLSAFWDKNYTFSIEIVELNQNGVAQLRAVGF